MRMKVVVLGLILVFTAPRMLRASFASVDVIVPAAGQVEGSGGQMFATTLSVTNPSTSTSIGIRIELLRAGVNDPNPPGFNDTIAAGASRDYVNVAQSLFGLPSTERAAVRVFAPLPALVSTKLQASIAGEPVLSTGGFLYAAVPRTFAIGGGETATLRELQLQQNIGYHVLASETTGAPATIRVRVKNASSSVAGETLVSLLGFEQRLISAQSIVGPLTVSDGSIEVTVEQGTGRVLVAGSLVTNQVQPVSGFDIAANAAGLTGVFSGAGLVGGGTSGNVTLSVADGGITAPMLAPAAVTGTKIANGAVVRDINGKTDSVTIQQGTNITILNQANGLKISASDLAGDVTGPHVATVVKRVGGVLAGAVANTVFTVNDATNTNAPKTIMRRDSDGSADAEILRAGNGAADVPSFSFINDPRSGLYLREPGAMVLTVNGTERLVLGSTGTLMTGNLLFGGSNIYVGNNGGAPTETQTTRIGQSQTRAFVAGIRGVTTGVPNGIPVVVDSNGQLGTISSSGRYKFDIHDMDDTSALLRLRPVTFRYNAYGPDSPLQYGLIAEEVAKVAPDLVVFNAAGEPETVMYPFLTPMLLNEVQKQRRTIDDLQSRLERLEAILARRR
jgi:hypothetical protein